MINILLMEDKGINQIDVKCTFMKINIANLVYFTGDELETVTILGGDRS
ncbi:MAG: hypothetical protein RMY36_028325 [Nostoc sp. SerVER01]|nr:hypothetical protein [Nostoc sp. SerVER01]MDZ8027519.1 hypothetical protein [Nostoc sp. DedQUE11]MDZ8071333.1 hypothetical protein [Nostoc sp. DedQUE01]